MLFLDILASAAPLPGLNVVLHLTKTIWEQYQELNDFKDQLETLLKCIGSFLSVLNVSDGTRIPAKGCDDRSRFPEFSEFHALLDEILAFVVACNKQRFWARLIQKKDHLSKITSFQSRLITSAHAFQMLAHLDTLRWRDDLKASADRDAAKLTSKLDAIIQNQSELVRVIKQEEEGDAVLAASLIRMLPSARGQERDVMEKAIQMIGKQPNASVPLLLEEWELTKLEISVYNKIGEGGFGQIYRGTWMRQYVAIKKYRQPGGLPPSGKAVRKEVRVWQNLKHDHIIQLLAANLTDDDPFCVMPLCSNGNVLDYLTAHPDADRVRLLADVSAGLYYLHHRPTPILHGDLKAANVLIKDDGRAAISDFGLSRLKHDAYSRTAQHLNGPQQARYSSSGSLYWKAPERIRGESLTLPIDIYAFGMTAYEVISMQTPFHDVDPDHVEAAILNDRRPTLPRTIVGTPLRFLNDLITKCWQPLAALRPTVDDICSELQDPPPYPPPYVNGLPIIPPPSTPPPLSPRINRYSPSLISTSPRGPRGDSPRIDSRSPRRDVPPYSPPGKYLWQDQDSNEGKDPDTVPIFSSFSNGRIGSALIAAPRNCHSSAAGVPIVMWTHLDLQPHLVVAYRRIIQTGFRISSGGRPSVSQMETRTMLQCFSLPEGMASPGCESIGGNQSLIGVQDLKVCTSGEHFVLLFERYVEVYRQLGRSASGHDAGGFQFKHRIVLASTEMPLAFGLSLCGSHIAIATRRQILIHGCKTGQQKGPPLELRGSDEMCAGQKLVFTGDNSHLITAGRSLAVFDIQKGHHIASHGLPHKENCVRVQGKGSEIAIVVVSGVGSDSSVGQNVSKFGITSIGLQLASQLPQDYRRFATAVECAALSHSGDLIALITREAQGRVIEVHQMRPSRKLGSYSQSAGPAQGLSFSTDDRCLAASGSDGSVQLHWL